MTRLSVGDSVRVNDHDDVAEVEFVGLQSGAELTGADPVAVQVDWRALVD